MAKTRLNNLQTAQGMVEFALVLPLLLLLILGIFAFGHLFFVYSSVVSASREAARWGAAVGEAGPDSYTRYQDCDSIRARAVQVGSFAGVNAKDIDPANPNSSGIEVEFDHGPDPVTGASEFYASCPKDGEGPSDVLTGDRILVRVRVMYTPIVPVLNLPSFPLEATTFRTILHNVPVGPAPTAEDPCTTMTTTKLDDNYPPDHISKVGEYVIYTGIVTANDPTILKGQDRIPIGDVTLLDEDDGTLICSNTLTKAMNGQFACPAPGIQYMTPGEKKIKAIYTPDGTCHLKSDVKFTHTVERASSIINRIPPDEPITVFIDQPLTITALVDGNPPFGVKPTGQVTFTLEGQGSRTVDLNKDGVGSAVFVPTTPRTLSGTIDYPGDDLFAPAPQVPFHVTVVKPTPTEVIPPTSTPNPGLCPSLSSSFNFGGQQDGFLLGIRNNDSDNTISVISIGLGWPTLPTAKLQEIHFASSTGIGCGGSSDCLWNSGSGLNPPSEWVNNGDHKWDAAKAKLSANETKQMRMVFNHNLPNGTYHLVVNFSNGCQLDVSAERLITQ